MLQRLSALFVSAAIFFLPVAAGAAISSAPPTAADDSSLSWQDMHIVDQPPPSYGRGPMVYDPVRQEVIAYIAKPGSSSTWAWNGTSWRKLDIDSPPWRWVPAMSYDDAHHEIVLFGGETIEAVPVGDTWVFRDGRWRELHPAASPSPRRDAAMAYDPVSGSTILFGGGLELFSDTWSFDGARWTQLFPSCHPSGREHARLTYDVGRAQLVLFGGLTYGRPHCGLAPARDNHANSTWTWTGSDWTRLVLSGKKPPGRQTFEMATVYGRPMIVGGNGRDVLHDSWVLGRHRWREIPGEQPDYAYGQFAWDDARHQAIYLEPTGDHTYMWKLS